MKKKIISIFSVLLWCCSVIFFISTTFGYYSNIYHFTDEDLKWLNMSNNNDTIWYYSNYDNQSYIVLRDMTIAKQRHNHFYLKSWEYDNVDDYIPYAKCFLNINGIYKNETGYYSIKKINDSTLNISLIFIDRSTLKDEISINVNSTIDSIVIDDTNSRLFNNLKQKHMKEIVVKKGCGIYSFQTYNGEIFMRVEK